MKFSEPLKLLASFRVPAAPKGISVQLIISPRDVALTVESPMAEPYKADDSAIDPASILIGLNLSNLQPGTRITVPVTARPTGKNGSAVLVTLRTMAEGTDLGFAGRVLAADADGKTRVTTTTTLATEQHQALTKDVNVQRKVLLADQKLPFDEQRFAEALKTESEKVELFKGGAK